ncbi:hypothetical protein EDB19DRAFT_1695806 [Suillus lakei]|nr:hypothetical protein EDB19DRAFT_1695806 [Suillus lakei]
MLRRFLWCGIVWVMWGDGVVGEEWVCLNFCRCYAPVSSKATRTPISVRASVERHGGSACFQSRYERGWRMDGCPCRICIGQRK